MSRIYKNRHGFTLVEVVLVIAIIAILAAVVGISVKEYIDMGNSGKDDVHSQRIEFQSNNAAKNDKFKALGY